MHLPYFNEKFVLHSLEICFFVVLYLPSCKALYVLGALSMRGLFYMNLEMLLALDHLLEEVSDLT